MDVAMSSPLPVGLVRWGAPEPRVTVVVKVAYALRGGREAQPADAPTFAVDRPSEVAGDELAEASDFAPRKALADVILVGSARPREPATSTEAAFAAGELRRRFHAVSAAPAEAIPLSAAYLRDGPEGWSRAVRVGPVSPRAPERAARLRGHPVDREGSPRGALGPGFDFGFFNAAPAEQQLPALAPGMTIALEGMLDGAHPRELTLPALAPIVVAVEEPARQHLAAIELRLDTLVLDTDRALATLVWRGDVAAEALDRRTLLVAYEPVGTALSRGEILDRLDLAIMTAATEASALLPAAEPVDDLVEEVDPPTPRTGRHALASSPPESRARRFDPLVQTLTLEEAAPPLVLPYAAPAPTPVAPAPVAPAPAPLAPAPASEPPLPRAPSPSQPDELEIYATIQAAIWTHHPSLPELYARHGFDEATFRIRAREITDALEAEAEAGAGGRLLALDARLRAHVAALRDSS